MDHPEPISKRPMEIPQCRKNFTLEEARAFIDQVMDVFHGLEDMSDLRSMYETGKQLSRAYFDCQSFRTELAQHLTSCEYPAFASKMMKKLNNMGVFKNDDIWFSSFYFYNTTWNFSFTWPEFASALGAAGLPNLLNLNIGHQPYLDNLSSKNVYYLIKASLSIIHNIARVPGNTHFFTSESVRQALLQLAQREEEFLRCVSTLCLAHIIMDSETHLVTDTSPGGMDLPRALFGYISSARMSEKRRCHGFQVLELLCALSAFSVNDSAKLPLLNTSVPAATAGNDHGLTCTTLLKDLIDAALVATSSVFALREAEEAIRILWNLTIDPSILPTAILTQLKTWIGEVLSNPSATSQFTGSMMRALESISWKLNHITLPTCSEPTECGSILLSFAPSNRIAVSRIADRLKEANLPISSLPFGPETLSLPEASSVGLSMCACNTGSRSQWFEALDRAPVLIVCLSDAYRLSPGCRLESEYFMSQTFGSRARPVVPIILQPKLKPTGWLNRVSNRTPIECNGKRDMEVSYDTLVGQLKEVMIEARKRAEAAVAAAAAARRVSAVDGKRHMATAGDTGVPGMANSDALINHLNGGPACVGRAPSGLTGKSRDDFGPPISPHGPPYKSLSTTFNPHALSNVNPRIVPTYAWRHVVRPEVRNWSTATVATWLRFRGLGHIATNVSGGIDGVLLSQLAGLRLWAPEYFNQSIRAELGLDFTDSLRFLEALDELAPEDEDTKGDNCDGTVDHLVNPTTLEGGLPRTG